ncbi:MAG: hypothetical protein BJ554DRAFT_7122 [Olpidium bornovanus]|uniref:Uncharacterized protein n=1 Tax=Olpidium bornovanus TaxID=278681 RepID=A0A8H7ZWP3_9FUNG|nr:MAG: hypothetical protein BJ554DRAFT_7122 [Olpidium bornovanus]
MSALYLSKLGPPAVAAAVGVTSAFFYYKPLALEVRKKAIEQHMADEAKRLQLEADGQQQQQQQQQQEQPSQEVVPKVVESQEAAPPLSTADASAAA